MYGVVMVVMVVVLLEIRLLVEAAVVPVEMVRQVNLVHLEEVVEEKEFNFQPHSETLHLV
jgi:hypothetical protein